MDSRTIERLNAINREFYRITADEFDQTRGTAWEGWKRMVEYVRQALTPSPSTSGKGEAKTGLGLDKAISVLDVGCGNGRFGVFLREQLEGKVRYHGIDSNRTLLDHARAALNGIDAQLEERDIVENSPDTGEYDLVALFGVIHHIPGNVERQMFMHKLAERVKNEGLLVFACWRFYEYERFRERITPWPDDLQVEAGDYLLDWRRGEVALRYCHYVDDAEQAALIAATGLSEVVSYRADGQDGRANQYAILRKT